MNTRKYPRTLEEAFGPYQRHGLVDQDPMPTADKIVIAASCAALLAILGFALMGWL
jgi:hypothetical protein